MLFDTNILIDYLRGSRDAAAWFADARTERPAISAVSVLELYAGVTQPAGRSETSQLLTQLSCSR